MMPPNPHPNEYKRLQKLASYEILDSETEQAFDDLAKIAAFVFDAPIALISLVDDHRQWFKTHIGLDAIQTPKEFSFCGHLVASEKELIVQNALHDARFADNPLVTGNPKVIFYAGVPLSTSEGPLGSLCVIDHRPRLVPSEKQMETLRILARQVMIQMEIRLQVKQKQAAIEREEQRNKYLQDCLDTLNSRLDEPLAGNPNDAQLQHESRLVQSSQELILVVGFDRRIKMANASWRKFFGFSDDEIDSIDFKSFIHPDDLGASMSRFENRMDFSKAISEVRVILKSGETRWLTSKSVTDLERQCIYSISTDITSRKEVEKLKHEFLAMVSHELRNPLSNIEGALNILGMIEAETLSEKGLQFLTIANDNTKRLGKLVGEILDLEKLELGKMNLNFAECDLSQLVSDVVQEANLVKTNAELCFKFTNLVSFPALTWSDSFRIRQVLENFLSNAVRYGNPTGEILVTLSISAEILRTTVKNYGPCIPDEFRSRIFQRFAQAKPKPGSVAIGNGLGLSIVKEIVELHGGKVGFESTLSTGTEFYFDISCTKAKLPCNLNNRKLLTEFPLSIAS
jgi:PAS domain S-box-containing protein